MFLTATFTHILQFFMQYAEAIAPCTFPSQHGVKQGK